MHTDSSSRSLTGRTLEFRIGSSLLRRSHAHWLNFLAMGLSLAMVAIVGFLTMNPHGGTLHAHDVWKKLLLQMDKDPGMKWHFVVFAVIVPLGMAAMWMQRLAYIRLTAHGIEGYIPRWTGLARRNLTTGHWKVLWGSIRSARLEPGKPMPQLMHQLAGYRLVLETDRGQIRLSPFFWIMRNGPDHRLTLRQTLNAKNIQAADLVMRAPLIKSLQQRGIDFVEAAGAAAAGPVGFDLAKHRGLLIELVLFFGAGLYALVDGLFIAAFKPLETLPLLPFLVIAVVALVTVSILGRGAPTLERSVVGIITVVALTAAVYPGLLRVNALSAEPQSITYKAVAAGRFEPLDRELPAIDLTGLHVDEYLAQYPPGKEHEFRLLRGVSGFYQLDLRPFYAQTREFYKRKG
jgi:hypothetical protein